jgi:hypothetical protein
VAANSPAPPSVESWQTHYVRLIAFPVEPAYGGQQSWWEQLTGSPPDNSADQRQKRTREESGVYAGANLVLSIDQLRITWTAAADPAIPEEAQQGLPSIGPFTERGAWFVDLMQRWLASCPPVTRLAFVADLIQPAESRVASYRLLDRYLRHVELDHEGSDSFLYRINRPTTSESIPALAINRLTTWAALRMDFLRAAGTLGAPMIQTERSDWNAARVEMDINTAPDFSGGPLPQDRLAAVYAEMAEMALQIASSGDTRS